MAPKYGQRALNNQEREMREEITSLQFDLEIQDRGDGRILVDDAARFAARKVAEARDDWESDNAHKDSAPNIDVLRAQEATKRTNLRWRYGTIVGVSFMAMIVLAGLTATGHAV